MKIAHGQFIPRTTLFTAMVNRLTIQVGGLVGLINAVEMEDGSGHNFNVTLLEKTTNTTVKIFVKG